MEVFVARQPILGRKEELHAYELLFRSGTENAFTGGDGDAASTAVIHNSLAEFGLDALVGPHRAFINLTRRLLVSEVFTLLPRDRVVLEVLESVEPDEQVIQAVRKARSLGFQIALDDFVYSPKYEALLGLADIVKVDFLVTRGDERRRLAADLRARGVRLLAEKVETRHEFASAMELGFELFQGYFFCRPELVRTTVIPPLRLNQLALLRALSRSQLDFDEAAAAIKQDLSFSVKLLKYLNSAGLGLRAQVTSIRHASVMLGESGFRRWATLIAVASLSHEHAPALLTTSLVRARLCERVGLAAAKGGKGEYFFVGMLSSVDVVLGLPLQEVIPKLGLDQETQAAILNNTALDLNAEAVPQPMRGHTTALVLRLVLFVEQAAWFKVDALAALLGLDADQLAIEYRAAVRWAEETGAML